MTLLAPATAPAALDALSLTRLHLMRGGYLLMGAGLAIVKWPLLADAPALPLYEGVVLCLLTALSVLALLGAAPSCRVAAGAAAGVGWKLLWLGLVALPAMRAGDLDAATTEVAVNCSLVVVVLAVVPWRARSVPSSAPASARPDARRC